MELPRYRAVLSGVRMLSSGDRTGWLTMQSAADHHTRSLCAESPAQTEQWCCWLCRRRIILRSKEIAANSCLLGDAAMMANVRAERLLKIPAEPSPELLIPGAAAQTRVVSLAGIRLDSRKSVRPFKGIICDDISEFESHMPSHAVGLCRCGPCLPTSIGRGTRERGQGASAAAGGGGRAPPGRELRCNIRA